MDSGSVTALEAGTSTADRPNSPALDGALAGDASSPSAVYEDVSKPTPGRVLPMVFLEVAKVKSIASIKTDVPDARGTKIPGKLRVVEDHDGKFSRTDLKALAARPTAFASPMAIARHGNASDLYNDKKSFNIELQDEAAMQKSYALLGLPPGSDWVLYACANDKTCLRNVASYDLGRQMGHWTPRTRFVEVAMNGQYLGLYVLIEKIKRDKYRVDVPKVSDDPNATDLSGGYIWKVDSPVDDPPEKHEWKTPGGLWFGYHYPTWDQITDAQRKGLQGEVAAVEKIINSATFADPVMGYASTIDVKSFVDYLLVEELSYNVDGIWRSAYFYKQTKDNGNKTFAGPLWDFDLAYGNAEFRDAEKPDKGWQHEDYPKYLATVDPAELRKYRFIFDVWTKLFNEAAFQKQFRCRWKEMRSAGLDQTKFNARMDDWSKEIASGVARDRDMWKVAGAKLFANPADSVFQTYAEDLKYLKDFISRRVKWLDGKLDPTNTTCGK